MALKFLCTVLVALVVAVPVSAETFVSVIDDLPLMSGLAETGEGVEFSTPQGRLVETTASGKLDRKAVLSFYSKTLPQLGWTQVDQDKTGDARFVREGETLDLLFGEDAGKLTVRFSLAPTDK